MSTTRTVEYSAAAAPKDLTQLSSTRFIDMEQRRYPFRDALGRINLNLVNASLAEAEQDGAACVERLRAWQRHAIRAIAKRPKDEQLTLDQLAGESDHEEAAATKAKREPPQTVAMRRRLFRKPEPDDEPIFDADESPEADWMHRCRMVEEGAKRRKAKVAKKAKQLDEAGFADEDEDEEPSGSSHSTADDDMYEVDAILDEDEQGGRGFLIRWAGFSEEHDSWEPEWNIAPHLVGEFRKERDVARRHVGDDYMLGRKRMLWCGSCCAHFAADSFSANQRRNEPCRRQCLVHHYKTESATLTPLLSTPARAASNKRPRTVERSPADRSPGGMLSLPPPPPPLKAPRPVARALSHRQAALELRTSRLFGFGSM